MWKGESDAGLKATPEPGIGICVREAVALLVLHCSRIQWALILV